AQAALEAPPEPTNLRFEAVTDSSCTVRWAAVAGATDYDVNYKPAVGGKWTNEPHRGTGLSNTINDLDPDTEYRWAVRAENSDGYSAWVFGPNFTTEGEDETTGSVDDHSNTRSGATSLSLGSSLAGQIETGSDVDYFSVQVGASGTLTVYTTGSLDTKGLLENSSGSTLASNDDGGSDTNFRIERSVSADTYYIKVESYRSRTGSYTIHANETTEGEDEATEEEETAETTEEESESSEDGTEDFLIPEPSLPPLTVRENFKLTPFYQQWIDVEGYPVVASENVNPYALKEAAWLIRQLMSHRPDVLQAMVHNKASHSVMAYNEMTTDIPEHSDLRPDFFWDKRARGLGSTASSCGEENLLNYPGDPYDGYHVMIHEFSHSVHLDGLNRSGFDDRLRKAFEAAIAKGLWKGTYASSNRWEYWAEGVQAWFNAHFEFYDINTRAELKEYDPALAKLIAEAFGDTDWRYTRPTTRTHLPHLQGFDPEDSPTFEWPPELVTLNQQLFEPDADGGGKWVNLEPYNPSSLSSLRSPSHQTGDTEIIIVNQSEAEITVHWIDSNGTETFYNRHASGVLVQGTFVGHIWLIKDQHGNDLAVFRAEEKMGRAFIGEAQAKLVTMEDRLGVLDIPQLQQNAPNPFNSQTVLSYFLPTAGPARVEVFALTGQRVATLRQGPQSAGHHRLHWNGLDAEGRPLASGIYLYRLATDFGVLTRKLMLLR
ncbi:MAG: fibronectin type III domain-containing protein, partial [Gemmatimonadota bacterium]|nr:fibronectin type III domain-containing protein [Gemmatimonadota bacterium]